jgi:hypothetical protein
MADVTSGPTLDSTPHYVKINGINSEHSSTDSLNGERGCHICGLRLTHYNTSKTLHSLFWNLDQGITDFQPELDLNKLARHEMVTCKAGFVVN